MSIQEAPEHGPHVFVNKPELGIASTLSEKADFFSVAIGRKAVRIRYEILRDHHLSFLKQLK